MSLSYLTPYNDMLQKTIHEMKPSPADVANYPEILPMMGGRKLRDSVVPESLPYASPLGLVKEAERELRSNPLHGGEMSGGMYGGMYGGEMSGGNIFEDAGKAVKKGATSAVKGVKKGATSAVKGVKKGAKSVEKGAKKFAKSETGKEIGRIGKEVGSFSLDLAEKTAVPLGAAGGVALATAIGQPALAPVLGAVGAKTAGEIAKSARKGVKSKTGLGVLVKLEKQVKEGVKKKVDKLKEKGEKKKEGSGRAPSKWVEHLRQYAKDNDVSYKQAMKDGKASYRKG